MSYIWDQDNGFFRREQASDFFYSDGAEIEEQLYQAVRHTGDKSVFSAEMHQRITDWPTEYYLSRGRHCLLRPLDIQPGDTVLELGCGCGALTRYLGEVGAKVVAVDGSAARARIAAERCSDLPNVRVFVDDLLRFQSSEKFDWVLLIGVLEYAPVFSLSDNPALHYLKQASSHLAEQGRLVIAIENKLGLKYFNACGEDHVGKPFFGIQGLYGEKSPCTYGRRELLDLLDAAGLGRRKVLYPFPDYKLPTIIFSDEALLERDFDVVSLIARSTSRDYGGSSYRLFDEALVFAALQNNGLLADFSHSFLVVAMRTGSVEERMPLSDSLAVSYAVNRIPRLAVVTRFYRDDEGLWVQKTQLSSAVPAEIDFHGFDFALKVPSRSTYHRGKLFLWDVLRLRAQNGSFAHMTQLLLPWVDLLCQFAFSREQETFPRHQSDSRNVPLVDYYLPGDFFDCVPFNLINSKDGLIYFDDEWEVKSAIPLGWIITRGVLHSFGVGIALGEYQYDVVESVQAIACATGFSVTEDEVQEWIELEEQFMRFMLSSPYINYHRGRMALPLYAMTSALQEKEAEAVRMRQSLEETRQRTSQLLQENALLNENCAQLHNHLESIFRSKGWKFLEGFRKIRNQICR